MEGGVAVRDRRRAPHVQPVLRPTRFAVWWWCVVLAGGAVVVTSLRGLHPADPGLGGPALWLLAGFVVLGELRPIVASRRTDPDGVNLATAFLFAALLRWGLDIAIVGMLLSTITGETLRRKPLHAAVFNIGQYALSYAAASVVLTSFGSSAAPRTPADLEPTELAVVVLAAATYHMVNLGLVGVAIAYAERRAVVTTVFDGFAYLTMTTGAVLALAPLVVVVATVHWGFLPLLLLPLFLLHRTAAMSLEREGRSQRDVLTGLGNRAGLSVAVDRSLDDLRGSEAVAPGAGREGTVAWLCLIDVDRFKEVNDTLGHSAGDALLRMIGERLQGAVRAEDTVARLGGDGFVLLLERPREDTVDGFVERLGRALRRPYDVVGQRLELEVSVGIAIAPDDGDDLDELLHHADTAMYAAKEAGELVMVHDHHETAVAARLPGRSELLAELRRATQDPDDTQLVLHYQPQLSLRTGRVHSVEALVRWRHPRYGLLLPGAFLPAIECTDVMRKLTRRVLELALAQLARWRACGCELTMSVNVSLHDLAGDGFVDTVVALLERHGVPGAALMLELTEQALVSDVDRVRTALGALDDAGVRTSLDDFGTGRSSLMRLTRVRVAEIKIAREFVLALPGDPTSRAIVASVARLATDLGVHSVAEGVESAEVAHLLEQLGYDSLQGFHLCPPLPEHELATALEELRWPPAAAVVDPDRTRVLGG